MSKYKESTLKTYANKLERKFKNDCYFVCALPDAYSELLIGATVIFDNQGIRNTYKIGCWLLEDGNIRIEVFKNHASLKNVYYSVEVLSLNYAIDYIHEYITNDNEETASNSESEKHYDDYTSEDFIESGIAKIENINHCPNQNTCCIVSPFVHCNYNYKSDSCIKAHKNFIHDCEQVHKQMKAKSNPEWHHVSLATLANIDIDMLDEKRQRYFKIYKELIKTVNDLHKCKTAATYETRWWRFKQAIADDICYRGTTLYMTRFLDSKISMCNVECGLWSSEDEKATSFIKSRRYRHHLLK
jgi:hypothetical protein